MKSFFRVAMIASLFSIFSSQVLSHEHYLYPFCPCELITLRLNIVGLALTLPISIISGVKFIRAFTTRHDYARNFISAPHTIDRYFIDAHAITNRRNKLRSKTVHVQTFSSKKYQDVIKKCCSWANDIDQNLILVVQPALSLQSGNFVKLKKLTFKGQKQRTFLDEKLISHFEVTTKNRWTYGKRAAAWGTVLAFQLTRYRHA